MDRIQPLELLVYSLQFTVPVSCPEIGCHLFRRKENDLCQDKLTVTVQHSS